MRVPSTASPEVQQAFREIWQALDRLGTAGEANLDLRGKRIINAGPAVDPSDYATKADVARLTPVSTGDFDDIHVKRLVVSQLARFLAAVFLPRLTDGSKHHVILFVAANGQLSGVNDGAFTLAYNDTDGFLELGYGLRIKWVSALSSIGSAADGVIDLRDNAGSGFARLVLGPDDASGLALVKNGTTLELRVGGGGALTNELLDTLNATTVNATTVNATTVNATTVNANVVGNLTGNVTGNVTATTVNAGTGNITTVNATNVNADHFNKNSRQTYSAANVTTDRTYDADATTLDELADVLGTLLDDLKTIGLVG